MEVEYKNSKMRKVCTDASAATKEYGPRMAEKIHQRIDELRAAESVEMMIQFKIGRCHPLAQNRAGQYAVDLVHPRRLIFTKRGDEVQIARIEEVADYR